MPKQTIPPDLQSQKLVLDSLILEYKTTFERSDKLGQQSVYRHHLLRYLYSCSSPTCSAD